MYEVIVALSGLGMFLFGMTYMELSLKEFAGAKFKHWLKQRTAVPSVSFLAQI